MGNCIIVLNLKDRTAELVCGWLNIYKSRLLSMEKTFLLISMLLSSTCLKMHSTNDPTIPKVRVHQVASFHPQWPSGVNPVLAVLAWNSVIAEDLERWWPAAFHGTVIPQTLPWTWSGAGAPRLRRHGNYTIFYVSFCFLSVIHFDFVVVGGEEREQVERGKYRRN